MDASHRQAYVLGFLSEYVSPALIAQLTAHLCVGERVLTLAGCGEGHSHGGSLPQCVVAVCGMYDTFTIVHLVYIKSACFLPQNSQVEPMLKSFLALRPAEEQVACMLVTGKCTGCHLCCYSADASPSSEVVHLHLFLPSKHCLMLASPDLECRELLCQVRAPAFGGLPALSIGGFERRQS